MREEPDDRLAALTPKPRREPLWLRRLGQVVAVLLGLLMLAGIVGVILDHEVCHPWRDQAPGKLTASCTSAKQPLTSTLIVRDVPTDRAVRVVGVFDKTTTRPGEAVWLHPGPDGTLTVKLYHGDWGNLREIRWV